MEKPMNRIQFLKLWSLAVGSMDAVTGLLLIFVPTLVLKLLGIAPPSLDALVFLSWMGVFIAGVGLSYAMALGGRARGESVWLFTAVIRILVAVFLTVKIFEGTLVANWGMVGVCDGIVGVSQLVILRLGWWKEVPK
jgi:hypothetical protein